MGPDHTAGTLPPGLIFEIAEAGGLHIEHRRPKTPIRCPFHQDRHASAFVSELNVFFCAVCTPNGGMSAKNFAAALGVDWGSLRPLTTCAFEPPRRREEPPGFTGDDAATVWHLALGRARDDHAAERDRETWDFVAKRGLSEGFEVSAFGVLANDMSLPAAVSQWPRQGYRIIAPLYDLQGRIANVQARNTLGLEPKTMFPSDSHAAGTLFACPRGLELLAGNRREGSQVILGEGLTDFIALAIASPWPVLAAPGTGMVVSGLGPWVCGADLYLALDIDEPGDRAAAAAIDEAFRLGATSVHRVEWPDMAKDACEVIQSRGAAGLDAFLRERVMGGAS